MKHTEYIDMGKYCCKIPTPLQVLNGGILQPSATTEHTYGPDLVTSGTDFADPSWQVGADAWEYLDASGAKHKAGTVEDSLTQEIVSELAGLTYRITIVVELLTAGSFLVSFGDTNLPLITSDGTYIEIITTATDTDIIAITASVDCDGAIRRVIIEQQLT